MNDQCPTPKGMFDDGNEVIYDNGMLTDDGDGGRYGVPPPSYPPERIVR